MLPPKMSIDGDGLCYKILKEGGIPLQLASYLCDLFSLSLERGIIPSAWKIAVVTPIYKKGSRTLPNNYRPISVTSCCSRVLERIVRAKITDFLHQNRLISDSQHGFRVGKSTDTILLCFYDYVTKKMDSNMIVDAIFFDFAKAFDKIPHDILIKRLQMHGISGSVIRWIRDFLTDRLQKVRIGNSLSDLLPVSSGIIQGSVLGPTLFNVFINDIDASLKYCSILKYADDLRIFLSSPKHADALLELQSKLQHDVNSISEWAVTSGMTFNINKCFYATFGQYANCSTRSYKIHDDVIPSSSCFEDLGVTVHSPLSFNKHMDRIVTKAFSRLALINKVFQDKSCNSVLRLYKAIIRPTLDFSSIVWNPFTIGYTKKVERVQKRMCRIIPSIRHLSYNDQLVKLNMLSLYARRIRFQLISVFKMYKNITNVDFNDFFTLLTNKRTRGHSATLQLKHANNNYRLNFFTVSTIDLWNKLPQTLIDESSLAKFKIGLNAFLLSQDIH